MIATLAVSTVMVLVLYEHRKNTTQFYLVFHMNEQDKTELSKKIVRICRNQHARCKTKANLHEYEHELT